MTDIYYNIKITFTEGVSNIHQDINFKTNKLVKLIQFFDRIEKLGYIVSWTVKEYNKPTFEQVDLVSEQGSNHPINAGAIFWTLFDEEGIFEETLN